MHLVTKALIIPISCFLTQLIKEPVLFQGSVFDNIAYGLVGTPWEHASKAEQMVHVQEAAKIAFAHDFIMDLPQGYDTDIGQRGSLLSGGQKQRIAIARSIVSHPKVLLLDEATSALDPHAEGVVQQALDRASEGRTTIVIAHKLATIRKAHNIVVMSKGRIVEQGTHEELIARDGTYARLVRIQDLSVKSSGGESTSDSDQDEEGTGDGGAQTVEMTKTLTRYATEDRAHMEVQRDRDDFKNYKPLGLLAVIARLVRETPELAWWYLVVLVSCVVGGKSPWKHVKTELTCIHVVGGLMLTVISCFLPCSGCLAVPRHGRFHPGRGCHGQPRQLFCFDVCHHGCSSLGLLFYHGLGSVHNRTGMTFPDPLCRGLNSTDGTTFQTLSHKLRRQSFNNILRQDLQFFDRPENTTGALVSRIDSYPQSVFELMGVNVGLILIAIFNVAACSILGIAYSWKLGLAVVFGGLPPMLAAGWLKIRLDMKLDSNISKRNSGSASIASEAITAIRTVSSLAIEGHVLDRYTTELNHAVNGSVKPLAGVMICFAFTQAIEYWFMALGFWYVFSGYKSMRRTLIALFPRYGCRLIALNQITLYKFFVAFMGVFLSAQGTAQLFGFSTS